MAISTIKQVTNNSGSNYCKMPDGTLIQWGELRNGSNGAEFVNFPVPFVDANYTAVASIKRVGSQYAYARIGSVQILDKNRAVIYLIQYNSIAAFTDTDTFSEWIAIGRWK